MLARGTASAGRRLVHDMRVYVKGINAYYRRSDERARHKPWTHPRRDRPQRDQEPAVRQGGGNEVRRRRSSSTGCRTRSAPTRATRSGTTCASARTRRRPSRSRAASRTRRCPAKRTGNVVLDNGSFQARRRSPARRRRPRRGDESATHASNVLMVAGKRSRSGHPLFVGGSADRLLLSRPDARDGPARPRLERARRHLRAVPGLHPDRARARTSSGRSPRPARTSSTTTSRRSAAAATRSTSTAASAATCRTSTPARSTGSRWTFNRTVHGPVIGYATVDGRRVAVSRKRSSYLLDGVDLLLFQRLTRGRMPNARDVHQRPRRVPADVQHVLRGQQAASPRSRPAGCRSARRAWTRACPPTARASSSGAASCKPGSTRTRSSRAAC